MYLHRPPGNTEYPFQEAEWHRCIGERAAWMPRELGVPRKGPWMALVRRPPEQRWIEGSRAQRDPYAGAKRFCLLFFPAGQARLEKVGRPAGRNRAVGHT